MPEETDHGSHPAPPRAPRLIERVGPYAIEGELGVGGAARVYRARSPAGEVVALKLIARARAPESVARFQREKRLQGSLGEEDGFVPLLDAGDSPAGPYLVMPLVAGGTLRDRLERGPLDLEDALALGIALGRAAGRAHERGIVHRDLKPENVLFSPRGSGVGERGSLIGALGRPLIADLGLAKHWTGAPGAAPSLALSKTGQLRGTAQYMAPEQVQDARSVGPAADVFALGAVLWECLAGRPAFEGDSVLEVLAHVADGRVPDLRAARPEVPAWLAAVVARALAPDPEARWRDGHALAAALARTGPAPTRGGKRLVAAALGTVVLAAAALLVLRAWSVEQRRREETALLERAEASLRRHEAPAAGSLDRALELAPTDARAWLDRALAHELALEKDAAEQDGTRALALAPDDAATLAIVASLEYAAGKKEAAAARHAARALALDPRQSRALRVRGMTRLESTDPTERQLGTAELAWAVALAPDDAVAWRGFGHGLLLIDERTPTAARGTEALTIALFLDPRLVGAWTDRATALSNHGEHQKALADLDRALALEPGNARALAARGYARVVLGEIDAGSADARRALAIDSKMATAFIALGIAAHDRKDEVGALEEMTRALDLEPDNTLALYVRARARHATHDDGGALVDATSLVRYLPDDARMWLHRGELRDTMGDLPGAIEDYGRAIALDDKHGRTWLVRGRARDRLHAGDGLTDLERSVALDPDVVEGWNLLQADHVRAGNYEAAVRAMDQAAPHFAGNMSFVAERAALLSEVGRVAESEAEFDNVLAHESKSADVHLLRGNCRLKRNELERAIVDFDRAVALDPPAYMGYVGRARAYALRGENDRALADATTATTRAPRVVTAWVCLAFCRLQAHDSRAALDAARRATTLEPENPFALAVRGLCRAELADAAGARADLERAMSRETATFVQDLLGRLAARKLEELGPR